VTVTSLSSAVDLLQAIDDREIVVHYQAIFDVESLAVVGAEALVRWLHPQLGLLTPDAFLPTDLDGGLGWALTNFVLEEAIRQCAEWRTAGEDVSVAVNISPGRLVDEILPEWIASMLAREGLPPKALTIEVTEQRFRADPIAVRKALDRLATLGVEISLDDFGTGDSSLNRLRYLHFDELKIDREFIQSVATNPTDRHISRFTAMLGTSLGSRIVAEGVETIESLDFLRTIGVQRCQGFLLHRPSPADRVLGHAGLDLRRH
jgi:EAL domain-containing protein (putative c-di-GMP-specific phosphodiesterase class I)